MQLPLKAAGAGSGDLTLEDPSLGGVVDFLPELFTNRDLESSDIMINNTHVNLFSVKRTISRVIINL